MSWFIRMSRGHVHAVYGQQAVNSCGIACIIMINFKLKKWQLAAAAALGAAIPGIGSPAMSAAINSTMKAEKEVYAAYAEATGQPYDGTSYTDMYMLAKILNGLSIGNWAVEYYAGSDLGTKITKYLQGPLSGPIMLHIQWRGKGCHFVVCDEADRVGNSMIADICDPGSGTVQSVTISTGGGIPYVSNNNSVGDFTGWIAYRTG